MMFRNLLVLALDFEPFSDLRNDELGSVMA
jgi:hypothetical protein